MQHRVDQLGRQVAPVPERLTDVEPVVEARPGDQATTRLRPGRIPAS
ncbi:hypothetical protein [Cryptosporangium sp. NPDC051539]